jgi:glutamate racemase
MLGVIAANNQSLAGIERTLQTSNPDCWPLGASLMPVVLQIEAAIKPEVIVHRNKLEGILEAMQAMGAEALLLGCTHFPYLKEELEHLRILPIIDPADRMAQMLHEGKI